MTWRKAVNNSWIELFPKRRVSGSWVDLGGSGNGTGGEPPVDPDPEVPTIAAFGPNGTHWPADTPRTGHAHVVDVACSWSAISTAIAAVTSQQASGGTLIRVAPGTLAGNGGNSTSTPVVQNVGNGSWAQKVLVAPRDGWGTVTITSDARINNVQGVTFARFNGTSLMLTNCSNMNWAQSKLTTGLKTFANTANTTNCNVYEMVMPNSILTENDSCQYSASSGLSLRNCTWEGCYVAPLFRPTGSSSHLDTLQMFGAGFYRGLTLRDCLIFGSQNCALQGGGYNAGDPNLGQPFVTLNHTMLLCQQLAVQLRYSVPSGAEATQGGQAINGPGEPGPWFASDSYVLGSMHSSQWTTISNSYTSYADAVTGNPATNGAWIYESWSAKTPAQFDAMVGAEPNDAYLASVWT